MSVKSLPFRHNCPRENCQGHARDYNNYLQLTKTKPKSKPTKTARSFNSLHDKPKEKAKPPNHKHTKHETADKTDGEEQRRRSEQLEEMLQEKSKKINEMKHRIKDYEARIKDFERREREFEVKSRHYESRLAQLQAVVGDGEHPKSPISLERPTDSMMTHYQQQLRLLETSQKATLDAVEKYRLIERDFHEYRTESERKLERLVRENEQLRQFEPDDKAYDQEISSLRKELHRLSHTQQTPSLDLEDGNAALRAQVRQLVAEQEALQMALREKEEAVATLRRSLEAINRKVDRWNQEYKQMTEERRTLEQKYNDLAEKYGQRKERQAQEKKEWAGIFSELMREVEKLKKEISRLERARHQIARATEEDE